MVHYPLQYHAESNAGADLKEAWETIASDKKVKCSIPEIYQGSGEALSPEEFFLLSLQNCFIASFKVYASHMHLEFEKISVTADLIVNNEGSQGPVMKSVEMFIKISKVHDEDMARDLIYRALQDGFIFNSIKTEINSHIEFD